MGPEIVIFSIVTFAFLIQSMAGFGAGMIAMPLLVQTIGLPLAAPMFVLTALIAKGIMITRYWSAFSLDAIWRLIIASIVGIPLGITFARRIPERMMLILLGLIVVSYALYSLIGPRMVQLRDQRWGFGFGLVTGLLAGAYNTGGPPLIIYGTSQSWEPAEFKGNLQVAYLTSTFALLFFYVGRGDVTGDVMRYFLLTIPAVLVGMAVGFSLERFVSPVVFRKSVLILLLLLGLTLIF